MWLGRYLAPFPLRSKGAFHRLTAVRASDGQRVVVVIAGPRARRDVAAEALGRAFAAHREAIHPRVPIASYLGTADDTPFLELECPAFVDALDALKMLADKDRRVPYTVADTLFTTAREAMQAAHKRTASDGGPLCLGRISLENMLFCREGRLHLVGFGHNFCTDRETGAVDPTVATFQAVEISLGARATPDSDYVGLLGLTRSLVAHLALPPLLERLIRGDSIAKNLQLFRAVRWFEQRILAAPVPQRAKMEDGIRVSRRVRRLLGIRLDLPATEAFFREVIADAADDEGEPELTNTAASAAASGPSATLRASPDCRRIEVNGVAHKLAGPMRRIVEALVERHAAQGEALTMWDVLEHGWPGEKPIPEAGANRVYVTMNRLRKGVLSGLLERSETGYHLANSVRVVTAQVAP